jgi:NAD(P)-dependent dehydrogenase (short-subunit alcohol dehydrogenase family)
MDVTDNFEKLRSTAKDAIDIYGKVDVLVNNAGLSIHGATEDLGYGSVLSSIFALCLTHHRVSSYLKTFQTNVFGMIGVTNAFLPHFRSRRDGTLVMMGSRSAWKPLPVKSHAFAFIVDELCSLRGRRYRAWVRKGIFQISRAAY